LTAYVGIMFEVYLAPNLLIQVIPMCLLWVATILWGYLMQIIGLQLVVARRRNELLSSNEHNMEGWDFTSLVHCFPCFWCPPNLGMDEFIILFHMTKGMMWLLEISLNVHVSTLSQCWQVLWVAMGCMCNVNMCITFYKRLCFVDSQKNSFITTDGLGVKFNVC